MNVRLAAQIFGWIFIIVAVLGFFTAGTSMEADPGAAPRLLGLFPVNVLHNLVHLAFGIWGVVAARSFGAARTFCLASGIIYLLLVGLAFLDPTTFGLVPIGGHDIWLHALLGIALLAAGLTAREAPAPARTA